MRTLLIILLLTVIAFSIYTRRRIVEGKKNKEKKDKNRDRRKAAKKKAEGRYDRAMDRINNMTQQAGESKTDFEKRQQKEIDAANARRGKKIDRAKMNKKKREIYDRTKKNNPYMDHAKLLEVTKTKAEKKRQLGKQAKSHFFGLGGKKMFRTFTQSGSNSNDSDDDVDLSDYLETDDFGNELVQDDTFWQAFILTQNESGINRWGLEDDGTKSSAADRKKLIEQQYQDHIRFYST